MKGPDTKGLMQSGPSALRRILEPVLRLKMQGDNDTENKPESECVTMSDDMITSIIEGDIVPRLLMAHTSDLPEKPRGKPVIIDESTISRFAELPLSLDASSLLEEVDNILEQGVDVEVVYLDLLTPTARALGVMWERDECDFVDVTMGLWRLQEVMREISIRYPSIRQKSGPSSRMSSLFAPMPGDVHSFGALMIDDVFARAGWESEAIPQPERRELLDTLSRRPFDLVGLTVSRECTDLALRDLIKTIRKVSANPDISVLLGGRYINETPGIVKQVGADGTGADAKTALEVARQLVRSAPTRANT